MGLQLGSNYLFKLVINWLIRPINWLIFDSQNKCKGWLPIHFITVSLPTNFILMAKWSLLEFVGYFSMGFFLKDIKSAAIIASEMHSSKVSVHKNHINKTTASITNRQVCFGHLIVSLSCLSFLPCACMAFIYKVIWELVCLLK